MKDSVDSSQLYHFNDDITGFYYSLLNFSEASCKRSLRVILGASLFLIESTYKKAGEYVEGVKGS